MSVTDLGRMTWPDVAEPIVVVPVGSCEQHGPHLPLHTDTLVASALARELVARRQDCVLAPALAITASGEHHGFAGTLSIGTDVMTDVLLELVRSADWAAGVVLVNGHGGNRPASDRAVHRLVDEGRHVLAWWPSIPDGDLHAGHAETSLMLALAPDDVRREQAVAGPVPALSDLVRLGIKPISPSGVLGDPAGASAEHGVRLLTMLTDQLVAAVVEWAHPA